jgi:hypothetical protein
MKIMAGFLLRISAECIADNPDSVQTITRKNADGGTNWANTVCPIYSCFFPRALMHYLYLMIRDNQDERRFF